MKKTCTTIKHIIALILFCMVFENVLAQTKDTLNYNTPGPEDYNMLSLEELMNIPISVSMSDLTIREVPSVISTISREEIKNMGARDLMDILNQVPGFSFSLDGLGLVGVGVRGNWALEGKILLLIDGQEMNEILYSSNHFGQHYDINNIERIEIIRGPGSSIYGGYAELGVISIITRAGKEIKGGGMETLYGRTSKATTRTSVNFAAGDAGKNVDYSLSGWYGKGLRSDQQYTDAYGTSTDLSKYSTLRPLMINGGVSVKGKSGDLSARVIIDKYQLETIDGFAATTAKSDLLRFSYGIYDLKYSWKVSNKLRITPRINLKNGSPYKTDTKSNFVYMVDSRRIAPSLNLDWSPSANVSIVGGVDSYFDHAKHTGPVDDYFGTLSNNNQVSFNNVGLFAQGIFKISGFNLTVGSRFDNHSQAGVAFSPRIGVTKVVDNFHFKLMYGQSFRGPAIEYINYSPKIKPEKARVIEMEVGYKLSEKMWLTGNVFYAIIDPIVFKADESSPIGGYYTNYSKTGTKGFELDYRFKDSWGYINANLSYASAKGINEVPNFMSRNTDNQMLSFPTWRLNLTSSVKLVEGLSLNPSFNVIGSRYAITRVDGGGDLVESKLDGQIFVNLFLRYTKNNFSAGVGVYDLLNEVQQFVQAYDGAHSPLPAVGREFNVRIGYFFSRK